MEVSEADLRAAVAAGVLPPEGLVALLGFLAARRGGEPIEMAANVAPRAKFDLSHVLWYAGALIVMSAMGLFSTLAFAAMGGTGLTVTALAYGGAFTAAGQYLWRTKNLRVPGGLLITIAVSMVPLAIYGIQSQCKLWGGDDPGAYQGFFNWSENSWLYMEVGTIAAAGVALVRYRFAFLVFVMAVMLWFMSMDVGAWYDGHASFGSDGAFGADQAISMGFGLGMMVAAWAIDRRRFAGGDYAFWLHLFGIMTFWAAVTSQDSDSEALEAAYFGLNVLLVLVSVFLMRPVYAVFGAIGMLLYLGHLAYDVFQNSLLFPFALSAMGVGVIWVGLVYYKRREIVAAWFEARLPGWVRRLRPAHAR
jgi:hypothetical protein